MTEFVNPSEILNKLKLRKDMVAADFGCGSGGWVLPLANTVNEGKIYAIDVLEEKLSALKSKARMQKLPNIETILDDAETKIEALSGESCDLVLMTNLLYLCEDKKAVLAEGKRVLKTGGRILVVDWVKDNPMTKEIEYVSFDEIKTAAKELGLQIEKEFSAGSYHLALIMIK
ncbi:MAG: class I SAM-dependent methyltransferase [Candidatus Nealsonbacteria bacterium]|nr:class I SAM-dependent methyltransferase [Candidatus Nealsonbacteria bacterium]